MSTIYLNWDLIRFSWLKNKKKWQRNKRLRKKFLKHRNIYVPKKIMWIARQHPDILKAFSQQTWWK